MFPVHRTKHRTFPSHRHRYRQCRHRATLRRCPPFPRLCRSTLRCQPNHPRQPPIPRSPPILPSLRPNLRSTPPIRPSTRPSPRSLRRNLRSIRPIRPLCPRIRSNRRSPILQRRRWRYRPILPSLRLRRPPIRRWPAAPLLGHRRPSKRKPKAIAPIGIACACCTVLPHAFERRRFFTSLGSEVKHVLVGVEHVALARSTRGRSRPRSFAHLDVPLPQ